MAMLSRTAESLYWMSRYMERAENIARLMDATMTTSLLSMGDSREGWMPALEIAADMDDYNARYDDVTGASALRYLALDPENSSSVHTCIYRARENARSVRNVITDDMWESINATWLTLKDLTYSRILEDGFKEFFDWVKERSHILRGETFGTMVRDDGFRFTRLGTFIERADSTARLLDIKAHAIGGLGDATQASLDYYQWGAVLQAVSARKAYRRIYSDAVIPRNVADLLILRADLPRSLRACYGEMEALLTVLAPGDESARLAGETHAHLKFSRIDDLMDLGLRPFLAGFLARNHNLAVEVRASFLMTG